MFRFLLMFFFPITNAIAMGDAISIIVPPNFSFSIPLERIRALSSQLFILVNTSFDFSHQKWKDLDGSKNTYPIINIKEYCGKLNIKKMGKVINKILLLGEYYLKQNNEENFKLILYALSDINIAFRTHGLYIEYIVMNDCNLSSITYEQFHDRIQELASSHFNKLIDLYVKKHGNLQVLLNKLSNP